ncbi:large ribosomal subunit protein uL16c [Cryptomeria japonica]|uniref:large ribosomal subunit protein uL16c n=1 Tax=Cryptomeria japonica TaxID=3369 RepID=UPI0027DA6C2E|nr:large ribosomal subunit protein uL16c [Cryptomeria japonica]
MKIPELKCVESKTENKHFHYSRFTLSSLRKGQANTIGSAIRRVLLGEVEGTCITRAKFHNISNEYSALEPIWITSGQIEAGRRAITRYACRGVKIWIRIFPNKPIRMRPAEIRMGSEKAKGSPEYWVSVVKPGRIIYEISGVSETIARAAFQIVAYKMPIHTKFITSFRK